MKAMILAAGEGTRLRPLTLAVPKPMVPIVGCPLLARTLTWLAGQGVTEAIINLYHRPQSICDFFGDEYAGLRLRYSFEETLRGTAGGVKAVEPLLSDAPFFVIYGDNLIDADLRALAEFHATHDGVATVALFRHPNPSSAGIVGTDSTGRITRFVEKPPPDEIFADTANAGIYVLDPTVMHSIPAEMPFDFGRDVFPRLLVEGIPLYGKPLNGYLQDTGTPDQYRQANWDALAGQIGAASADNGFWQGEGTEVSPAARFSGRNILGAGVTVGEGAELTDCIVWDRAKIGPGVRLQRAILGYGAVVETGTEALPGAILV